MRLDARLPAAFFAIYVVWGSTYLAIRVAVETIPPLATAGLRHLFAGPSSSSGRARSQARVTATEWRASLVVAVLFFLIGHGTLHWAEQIVPSGRRGAPGRDRADVDRDADAVARQLALEPAHDRRPRGRFDWRGVSCPARGAHRRLAAGVGIRARSCSARCRGRSACATLATAPLPRDPFVRASTTLLCGAVLLLTASAATGEIGRVDASRGLRPSLLGLGYLIVFGSVVAFSAYTWLLERCSATLVATHTYVNPVIAVLLGWLFAGEPLTMRIGSAPPA